jgi:hypothetical protein
VKEIIIPVASGISTGFAKDGSRRSKDGFGQREKQTGTNVGDQSWSATWSSELWTSRPPLYSMNPSFRNLFMKWLIRERVVPTSVSWLIVGTHRLRPTFLAEVRQQQQEPGQPPLAGVEELVHEVFFHPDVPQQEIRGEVSGNSAPS